MGCALIENALKLLKQIENCCANVIFSWKHPSPNRELIKYSSISIAHLRRELFIHIMNVIEY